MSKKKGYKKSSVQVSDVTINDFANAPKSSNRQKKSNTLEATDIGDSWDQINDDELDIVNVVNPDGSKDIVLKKRHNRPKSEYNVLVEDRPGNVYPEIVWYLVSHYIKPEDVGRFAGINKITYAITKRESFWRTLYKRYCENRRNLPEKLRLERSYRVYGLRQLVIRALYHTYEYFINKVAKQAPHDSHPHQLIKRKCVNIWYTKSTNCWQFFFKLKRNSLKSEGTTNSVNFIHLLSDIDANPDENSQVLQVTCQNFYEVPPLMGMTLSSLSVLLARGLMHHRLHLGFTSGQHFTKGTVPEQSVVLDTVVNIVVLDWWHPRYPHFDTKLPAHVIYNDEERIPVLKKDFFNAEM